MIKEKEARKKEGSKGADEFIGRMTGDREGMDGRTDVREWTGFGRLDQD